jgi:xylan 1,4-beta-xylosidase
VKVTEYRMDGEHSNAYAAWLKMGSPQVPTAGQVDELKKASELAVVRSGSEQVKGGMVALKTNLPRQGVGLIHLSW